MKRFRSVWGAVVVVSVLATLLAVAADADAARLDVNKASAQELEALPYVGPALAQRIVDFREAHGPFKSVDDLLKVQGIGEKILARLRSRVTVSGRGR
ncbi:MAG: ComEA family DNA-binding protein [Acidobacteriota bacterium]